LASDQPGLLEGAHADHILYIFDEAKSIIDDTFDAAEGALSSGNAYALMISTPGEPYGRFYEVHKRAPGLEDWHVRHVTQREVITAGRMNQDWAEQRKAQWGEGSAVYQNRVLGEFAASDEDSVIPLAWIELANERWREWQEHGFQGRFTGVGVDVAGEGEDTTVLALRYDCDPQPGLPLMGITELRRYNAQDTMVTAGMVQGILQAKSGRAVVDVIGLGAGVVHRLRELGSSVEAFNAAEAAADRAKNPIMDKTGELGFVNKRAAAWWRLRERLDPNNGDQVALPPDDRLTGDLTAPHWKVMSRGRIQVESKDDIRKRIGRSTDDGDAVVMAMFGSVDVGVSARRVVSWMGAA
jgi:hypothetical protein